MHAVPTEKIVVTIGAAIQTDRRIARAASDALISPANTATPSDPLNAPKHIFPSKFKFNRVSAGGANAIGAEFPFTTKFADRSLIKIPENEHEMKNRP